MVVLNRNVGQEILVALREKTVMLYLLVFFCVVLRKQRILFVDDAVEAKFHD